MRFVFLVFDFHSIIIDSISISIFHSGRFRVDYIFDSIYIRSDSNSILIQLDSIFVSIRFRFDYDSVRFRFDSIRFDKFVRGDSILVRFFDSFGFDIRFVFDSISFFDLISIRFRLESISNRFDSIFDSISIGFDFD